MNATTKTALDLTDLAVLRWLALAMDKVQRQRRQPKRQRPVHRV